MDYQGNPGTATASNPSWGTRNNIGAKSEDVERLLAVDDLTQRAHDANGQIGVLIANVRDIADGLLGGSPAKTIGTASSGNTPTIPGRVYGLREILNTQIGMINELRGEIERLRAL